MLLWVHSRYVSNRLLYHSYVKLLQARLIFFCNILQTDFSNPAFLVPIRLKLAYIWVNFRPNSRPCILILPYSHGFYFATPCENFLLFHVLLDSTDVMKSFLSGSFDKAENKTEKNFGAIKPVMQDIEVYLEPNGHL